MAKQMQFAKKLDKNYLPARGKTGAGCQVTLGPKGRNVVLDKNTARQ